MDGQTMDQAQAQHIAAAIMPFILLIGLVVLALIIVPLWVAFKKAGLPGALSLLVLIPGIGILLTLYVLAFATWKVVPAPEYGYAPPIQPPGSAYPPVYAQGHTPVPPPATGYSAPGAYTPGAPVYPPAPTDPTNHV